jgi:nuclear pore complex protein Nup133
MFPVPAPDPSSPYLTVPFASLLPFGASREPGLILVSSSGEVRFWDSIGTGLAGAERFSTTRIALAENESVNGVERVVASHL